ncbi:MAG: alpha/beta hydrolase [Gemmatimonadaceae bacterium]|nr:alpha/beta hydrolase [Gemmatimonadaceae bacterium]
MPLHSTWDTVGGLRVHGRIGPPSTGTPIVFVHGLGVSTRYMEPTMARLATRYAVSALDLPGFGRSESPPRPFTLAQHAQALAHWLDIRGTGPAVLVGNSYGCQEIVECVARASDRAVGLVLNAPTMDPAHRNAFTMIARVIADVPRESCAAPATRSSRCAGRASALASSASSVLMSPAAPCSASPRLRTRCRTMIPPRSLTFS